MVLKIRKDGVWVNIDPNETGIIKVYANGDLSAGDPVVLNSDGTVSKVSLSDITTKFKEGPSTPYNGSNSQYDTYSWTVDDGITELSVVCIGGGGGGGSKHGEWGGGGAGLGHITMEVTPGDEIQYQVGAGGEGGIWYPLPGYPADKDGQDGGDTWLKNGNGDKVVIGGGGEGVGNETSSGSDGEGEGGTYSGDSGGVGGQGGNTYNYFGEFFGGGGGGAGGYSGNGGKGGNGGYNSGDGEDGEAGSGGGGGGGGSDADGTGDDEGAGGGGGGTGILGEHSPVASGTGGEKSEYGGYGGEKGSGGQDGERGGEAGPGDDQGGDGGYYGGGGGKASDLYTVSPYVPGGDGGRGAIRIVGSGSNLTKDNYIGFSEASYSSHHRARINIIGSIDTNQSGLTVGEKYYLQTDGTLSTTEGNPKVEAGIALNSTTLLISGGAVLGPADHPPFTTQGWDIE